MEEKVKNTTQKHFDIFISYRRDGGSAVASFLHRELAKRDESPAIFFDTVTIGSGQFSEQIVHAIDKSSNFLILLTPKFMERCFTHSDTDWCLQEIQIAIQRRDALVSSEGVLQANNIFRIIPIFLGDTINSYIDYKKTKPEVWNLLEEMCGHNGVDFTSSQSFDQQFSKLLGEDMLLSPARKFADVLVNNFFKDKETPTRDELTNLFSCYLKMHDVTELSLVKDRLLRAMYVRLMDIIGDQNSILSGKLDGFKLSYIKYAMTEAKLMGYDDRMSFGSRPKIINSLSKLLGGEKVEPINGFKPGTNTKDRISIIVNLFSKLCKDELGKDGRLGLKEYLLSEENPIDNFSPNWSSYRTIVQEFMEHTSFTQMYRYIRKAKYTTKPKKVIDVLNKEAGKRILDNIWWGNIAKYYKNARKLNSNASALAILGGIEAFLNYDNEYPIGKLDLPEEADCDAADDAGQWSTPKEHLINLLAKRMHGATDDYKGLINEYLDNVDLDLKGGNIKTLLEKVLNINCGEFLLSLSEKGVPMDIKFLNADWKQICSELNLTQSTNVESRIMSIRKVVLGYVPEVQADSDDE